MEKQFKDQVMDILDGFRQMHVQLDRTMDGDTFIMLLDLTQQNAVSLGNTIEKAVPDPRAMIQDLQDYCEALYQLSLKAYDPVSGDSRDIVLDLDSYIDRLSSKVRRLPDAAWTAAVPCTPSKTNWPRIFQPLTGNKMQLPRAGSRNGHTHASQQNSHCLIHDAPRIHAGFLRFPPQEHSSALRGTCRGNGASSAFFTESFHQSGCREGRRRLRNNGLRRCPRQTARGRTP